MASLEKNGSQPYLVFGDGMPFGHEVVSAAARKDRSEVRDLLKGTRLALYNLRSSTDSNDRAIVKDINGRFSLESLVIEPTTDIDPAWTRNIVSLMSRAKNADLMEFCEWNVRRHELRQDALKRVTPALRMYSLGVAQKLIGLNFFPAKTVDQLEQAYEQAGDFDALDSFEAGGGMQASGYCVAKERRIGIACEYDDPSNLAGTTTALKGVVFHECLHLLGFVHEAGFINGITSRNDDMATPDRLIEEAFVGHSTMAATSRFAEPEKFIPGDRMDGGLAGSYFSERDFIGSIATYGPHPVPSSLLAEAYTDPVDSRSSARKEVARRLRLNLPALLPGYEDDAYKQVSALYEDTPECHRSALVDSCTLQINQNLGLPDIDSLEEDETPWPGLNEFLFLLEPDIILSDIKKP